MLVSDVPQRGWTCVVTWYSTFGNRAFAAAGPGLWNSLSSHLKEADLSYNRFRQLFGYCCHGAVWTILIAPFRNNHTYLITEWVFKATVSAAVTDAAVAMVMQLTGSAELSPVSVSCPTSSTQLQVPIKLPLITGDVQLTARLELSVSVVCHCSTQLTACLSVSSL